MLAKLSDGLPDGRRAGCSSPSGTASGRSSSVTATRCYTQSRDLKPLDRYFPELADPLRAALPERCVLDGEVVIAGPDGRSTSTRSCCGSTPPSRGSGCWPPSRRRSFVAWDLLALGDEDLRAVAAGRAPGPARGGPRRPRAADPPHPGDPRPRPGGRLVRPVRGGRARRGDREAARRAVPAGQAGDAQDQAPADGRLRRRRVPLAQGRARDADRVAPARALRRRRQAQPRRDHRLVHDGPPGRARRRAGTAPRARDGRPPVGRMGGVGRGRRRRPASACPARRAAGTAAATCPGRRSGRSGSSRSPTTTSRATGSATGRRSSAGARTSGRRTAATTSSRRRRRTSCRRSSGRPADREPRGGTVGASRIAFAGAGWIVPKHLAALDRLGPDRHRRDHVADAERAAATSAGREIADVHRDRSAARRDPARRGVRLPPAVPRRRRLCELLIGRGIPFLVEKPLAARDGDAPPRIADAIERAGLVVAVGYHWRGLDVLPEVRAPAGRAAARARPAPAGSTRRPDPTGGAGPTRAAARSSSRRPTSTTWPATSSARRRAVGAASTAVPPAPRRPRDRRRRLDVGRPPVRLRRGRLVRQHAADGSRRSSSSSSWRRTCG